MGPDPPTLKIHKNIGFLSNTRPDPLKYHKATCIKPNSMLGHNRQASETPFNWSFAGRPIMSAYSGTGFSLPSSKKKLSKLAPSGSAHGDG